MKIKIIKNICSLITKEINQNLTPPKKARKIFKYLEIKKYPHCYVTYAQRKKLQKKIRKYFELNKNNRTHKNLWNTAKVVECN